MQCSIKQFHEWQCVKFMKTNMHHVSLYDTYSFSNEVPGYNIRKLSCVIDALERTAEVPTLQNDYL